MYSVHPNKNAHMEVHQLALKVNFSLDMAMLCQSSGFKPIDLYNPEPNHHIFRSKGSPGKENHRDPLTNQILSERGNVCHFRATGVQTLQLAASEHGVHTYIFFYPENRNLN